MCVSCADWEASVQTRQWTPAEGEHLPWGLFTLLLSAGHPRPVWNLCLAARGALDGGPLQEVYVSAVPRASPDSVMAHDACDVPLLEFLRGKSAKSSDI